MDGTLGRPTWAEVDLGALARNLAALRARAAGRRVIGVVKADAYGHGAVPVARALVAAGCEALALATLGEAAELRAAGIECPLLLLQGLHAAGQADAALRDRLTPAVVHPAALGPLEAAGERAGRPFAVHLKVDTGMHRLGVLPAELDALLGRIAGSRWLELGGVMTHLAEADAAGAPATAAQRRCFADVLRAVRARGLDPDWIHADPSAGLFHGPTPGTTAVRPGIALYGPDPTLEGGHGLEPVMTLRSRVLCIKPLAAGARVGYGGSWVAPRATRLALLPLGYADGLARAAGGRFSIGVGGQRAPLVGRVSMDLAAADVGDLPVAEGDPVLIFGREGAQEIRAEELAAALDTIAYEVLVGIGRRVPRVLRPGAEPRAGAPRERGPGCASGRAGEG